MHKLSKSEAGIVEMLAKRQANLQEYLSDVNAQIGDLARMIQTNRDLPAGRPVFAVERGEWVLRIEPQPEKADA